MMEKPPTPEADIDASAIAEASGDIQQAFVDLFKDDGEIQKYLQQMWNSMQESPDFYAGGDFSGGRRQYEQQELNYLIGQVNKLSADKKQKVKELLEQTK
jgi:hypothetical protein